MNRITLNRVWTAILFAFLCLASARAAEAPVMAKAAPAPAPAAAYISTFTDSRTFGRDPFFPKSKRREPTLMVNTNFVPKAGELPAGLVLKGLSGTKEKPLAIINNYTFAAGEEAEVRVGVQLMRIKVVEIRERAVIVSVNGSAPNELVFRSGL